MLSRLDRWLLGVSLVIALGLRLSFLVPGIWQQPWTPHHFDEHILPYEALALWEGVTPREVGWPASTARLSLSVAYGVRMLWSERALLAREGPVDALQTISHWSGERVADGAPLYQTGRLVVATFGVLQVVFALFAARAWLGPKAMPAAATISIICPVAVTYSQFVLADIVGACFASLLLWQLARPSISQSAAVWLGVVSGLAAASKIHFGIWLVPVLAICWASDRWRGRRERALLVLSAAAAFGVTFVALVPWVWTNPVLGMKEFAGVTLVKVGSGVGRALDVVSNVRLLLGGLGWPVVAAAVPGLFMLLRSRDVRRISVAAVVIAGTAVMAFSAIVFDRYALAVWPGVALAATVGVERLLRLTPGRAVVPIALLAFLSGVPATLQALSRASQVNSYHLAHQWMIAHLRDGSSVVIYDEDNQYLPRSSAQLEECAAYVMSDAAYREKLATNDLVAQPDSGAPMRLAILNDELFHAFWCSRERLAPHSPSFVVRRFHHGKRFQTLEFDTLGAEFRAGLNDPAHGFDAVLSHEPLTLTPPIAPAMVFKTDVGPTLWLYLRSDTVRSR